jgi:hypothetical protein
MQARGAAEQRAQAEQARALQAEALKRQQALESLKIESAQEEKTYQREKDAKEYALKLKQIESDLKFKDAQRAEMGLPFEKTKDYQKAVKLQELKNSGKQEATPKQNEFAAAGYATRARQAVSDLGKLPEDIGTGFTDSFNGMVPRFFKGENTKLFEQAKRNFITANLRKESGATIGDDEYAIEEAKYFPEPGDSKSVIAQKAKAREQAILNLEAEGGNAMSRVSGANTQLINTQQAAPVKVNPQQVQQIKSMTDEELLRFVQGG